MNYDVIVIGGGLGGLTAGAKLAREGKKVLLIEQHSIPGGCATTFKRGSFTLEVGLHEMDGPSPRDMKTRIFNELEVTGNVEFIKVPEFYRFLSSKSDIVVPHDPVIAASILKEKFPDQSAGIDAYFDQILNPKRKAAGVEIKDTSLGAFLDSIISNEELKLVLLGNLGYFHDDPYSISLTYYSVAQGSYYSGGGSFIRGGSQMLSDHLANYIKNHGGEVLLNHLVTNLFVENNRITGVEFRKKRDAADNTQIATASEVVANAALPNIAQMAPEPGSTMLKNTFKDLVPGASLLTVYFGFNTNLSKVGNTNYSTFVFDRTVECQADIKKNNRADFNGRSFTFVDYGQIDSGLAPQGKSVGAVCCIDYLADWESLEPAEYRNKKEYVAKTFTERLEKIFPGFTDAVAYCEVGTPLTVERYTLNPGGAVYGFAQVPNKQIVDVSQIYDNLHIASAWGKTGGGFSGSIFSGYLAAYNLLRKSQVK